MKYLLNFLIVLATFSAMAQVGDKNFIDQNYIEVTGKAEMQIVPDLIYLKITLSEKDSKNKVSVTEMEKKMTDKFTELGIDVKKDLFVNDLLSFYRGKFISKADVILTKEYQLVVHNAKTAGKVFVELEKLDISNVSVERLDHTKIEEFRKEVKVSAIKAAKEKAESLTKAIDQNIGKALYIQELDNTLNDYRSSNSIRLRGVSSVHDDYNSKELELDFEKIKLEYSIIVRFELK